MNKKIKALALLLAALVLPMASGCALLSFDETEKVKQEDMTSHEVAAPVDIKTLLDDKKLHMEESLKNENGDEIAVYRASFPYFTNDEDSAAIDKINKYYEDEFSQMEDDKERFFAIVSEKPSEQVRSCIFDFELLDSPEGYMGVVRRCQGVDSLGAEINSVYCEMFNCSTGWQLRFTDIFGERAPDALTLLRQKIESWCGEKDYSPNWLYHMSDEVLTENIALGSDTVYVALPAFTAPGGETLLELSLDGFEEFLGQEE